MYHGSRLANRFCDKSGNRLVSHRGLQVRILGKVVGERVDGNEAAGADEVVLHTKLELAVGPAIAEIAARVAIVTQNRTA